MSETRFHIDAYLRRIGFTGDAAPTLATLTTLQRLHCAAIPFENLDPLLGRPVKLDLASLQDKLIGSRRGGYCFEQNLVLGRALGELGFTVTNLAGRVLWGRPEGAIPPRDHMLLHVEVPEGAFIVDAGFGGQTPTAPLRLITDVVQQTPLDPFRFAAIDDGFKLDSMVGEEWVSLYRFDLQPQFPIDYEAANYQLSTSPTSNFRMRLSAARATAGGRHTLLNNRLRLHQPGMPSEERMLGSAAEIATTLDQIFGLAVPDAAAFEAAIARLALFAAG